MNKPNSHSELHSVLLYTNRLSHCFDRLHNNAVKIPARAAADAPMSLLEVEQKFGNCTSTVYSTTAMHTHTHTYTYNRNVDKPSSNYMHALPPT